MSTLQALETNAVRRPPLDALFFLSGQPLLIKRCLPNLFLLRVCHANAEHLVETNRLRFKQTVTFDHGGR